MARFFGAKNVIHIKDVIAVLIIISIVLSALAGLCQNSAGVTRRFIFEARVANAISSRQLNGESLEGLYTW